MDFSIGLVKSDQKMMVKNFGAAESQLKFLDLEEAKEENLQVLFYPKSVESDELVARLQENSKFYPIRYADDMNLNEDSFERLEQADAEVMLARVQEQWSLEHNLDLIKNLFNYLDHFKNLWPNNRTSFFEELWFTLRNNLACTNLTIIYNDMVIAKKETEKNKLKQVKVFGSRLPETVDGSEVEAQVVEHYKNDFNKSFTLTEHNREKGEVVIAASIKGSPVLILARTREFRNFQEVVLSSFFEGLNRQI